MQVGLKHKGSEIKLEAKELNGLNRFWGLMFKRKVNAKALVFNFKTSTEIPIHSWFVWFDFIAIWVDEEGKIIDKRVVRPFTSYLHPKRKFIRLVEIPLNEKYKEITELLVGD